MRKILLIKKGAIGDVLMTTPLIRQLNKLSYSIDFITSKSSAVAIQDNPYIDKQYLLDDNDFTLRNIHKLARFYLGLRKQYEYVFVLDKHWYFALIAKLVGGVTVGFYRDGLNKYLLDKTVIYNDVTRYQVDYYLDLLNASGIGMAYYDDIKLDLIINQQSTNYVTTILNQYQITEYVVIINSGGNNSFEQTGIRMLPMVKFKELVVSLLKNGETVVLSGGKVDYDNNQHLIEILGNPEKVYNLAGVFKFSETGELFSKAKHVYVTDCGALHLAITTIPNRFTAYFGVTNPRHIVPEKLIKNTIWDDEGIYNISYQLYGKLRSIEPTYFTKLQFPKDL
ncbi:MAG: glycosyltransferase family 9 protein [Burkholderiales bacterium]|nr:glycosyltransferase family 9 protein [Burkholderiales bacterium]